MSDRGNGDGGARRPLIAGNWKMNLNHLEGIALVQKLAFALPEKYYKAVDVAVIPPFTHLRSIQTMIDGDGLLMVHGAQDLSPHSSGAYTGDVSGAMLAKLGCTYVIVGHSERREIHGETDERVNAKVRAALAHGLTPILCVGEGLDVREAGDHVRHCTDQLRAALRGVPAEQVATTVLAYEPVWAIGTGRTASPAQAQEVHALLRSQLAKDDARIAGSTRIVYGGSVKPGNAAELFAQADIDGGLIGGAALQATDFLSICAAAG